MVVSQIDQKQKYFFVPSLPTKGGYVTALAHCPYFLFVLLMTLTNTSITLSILIPIYIITIFITDYLFERIWKKEMSKLLKKPGWTYESSLNINYWIVQVSIFVGAAIEVVLVYTAVKLGYSSTLTFTLLVGAKIIGAPLQGWACDLWRRKPNFLFAQLISIPILLFLRLAEDPKAIILWLLLLKGFLGNVDSIARTILADERKINFSR